MSLKVLEYMSLKYLSLLGIVLQNSAMVLLLRFSRKGILEANGIEAVKEPYVISTAVCMAEIFKLLVALVCLYAQCGYKFFNTCQMLRTQIFRHFRKTMAFALPAALYLIQNNLLFIALSNLQPATYQITYQSRILFTTFFSWLLLGRRYKLLHMVSLLLLMLGVALVQMDTKSGSTFDISSQSTANVTQENVTNFSLSGNQIDINQGGLSLTFEAIGHYNTVLILLSKSKLSTLLQLSSSANIVAGFQYLLSMLEDFWVQLGNVVKSLAEESSKVIGLSAVLASCFISGFTGIYFERIVKLSHPNGSLLIQNIKLGVFSLIFGCFNLYQDWDKLLTDGFFHGYTWATWSVILIQTFGGLMVSVAVKYADNVLKIFATSISILLSSLISTLVLQTEPVPSLLFLLGAGLVIIATALYGIASRHSNC